MTFTEVVDLGLRNVHGPGMLEHVPRVRSWVYIGLRANTILTTFLPV